jgi:aminoglycoside phosphotransferase (APT) family kinase protein
VSEGWAEGILRDLGVTDAEALRRSVDTDVRYFRGTTGDGGPVFVKAVPALSPAAQDLRTEVLVASSLPSGVRSPRLVGFLDRGDSFAVAFQFVEGRTPGEPWPSADLALALDALAQHSALLTPCPVEGLPTFGDRMRGRAGTWEGLLNGDDLSGRIGDRCPGWVMDQLRDLADAEVRGLEHDGNTLLHFDLRHDNHLLTSGGILVLDWGRATIGRPWLDLMCLLLESDAGTPVGPTFWSHPLATQASPDDVTAALAVLASYWTNVASTPGDEVMRQRQAGSRDWALEWLRNELR